MSEKFSTNRRTLLKLASLAWASSGVISRSKEAAADIPRVLPDGSLPADKRLGKLKDLNSDFPWKPSSSIEEWKKRAEYVRRQLFVANGLWPMPTKHPMKPIVHGRVDREDFTVDRVILQTGEGLYCTGSLFRPKAPPKGKYPAVLCPHGHWLNGRFYQHTEEDFQKELASGAETLPSGKFPLQARCVQLARMGCVVFHYDMLGYADSAPLSFQLAHGFKQQRPTMSSPDKWGIFSAQSELRCLSIVGLQTWNSIRAFDWVSSLEDVDATRIGVTGASGGGTQTFLLGALDERPAAFFPAVMVSTKMQGGCTCENSSYLRVNTGNIEIAALIAPRPLGMTGADDWTNEIETKGLPELKQHYAMLGAPDNVVGKYRPFPHNYNQPSRVMMYEFFNKHLKLGQTSPIAEREFVPLTKEELTVWSKEHPAPEANEENELRIVRGLAKDQEQQFASLVPKNAESFKTFREVVGGAWESMIGRTLPGKDDIAQENKHKIEGEDLLRFRTLVRMTKYGEELPCLFFVPRNWNKHVAIWITDEGKDSLLKDDGSPKRTVQKLLDAGVSVAIPDLLYQGEFIDDGQPLTQVRRVQNPREFLGYTDGYNHPLFAQRVHDVLTMIAFCRYSKYEPVGVHLIGLGRTAGPIAAAAAFQAGNAVNKVALGTNGFRFAKLTDVYDPMLLPGAVRYGDLPGILALLSPHALWLSGEGEKLPEIVSSSHQVQAGGSVVSYSGPMNGEATEAVSWLLKGLS